MCFVCRVVVFMVISFNVFCVSCCGVHGNKFQCVLCVVLWCSW